MSNPLNTVANDFLALLKSSAAAAVRETIEDAQEVAQYAAQRAAHLSQAINEPGFREALLAERDNVALFAGVSSVNLAEAQNNRFMGLLEGSLALGARALALSMGTANS